MMMITKPSLLAIVAAVFLRRNKCQLHLFTNKDVPCIYIRTFLFYYGWQMTLPYHLPPCVFNQWRTITLEVPVSCTTKITLKHIYVWLQLMHVNWNPPTATFTTIANLPLVLCVIFFAWCPLKYLFLLNNCLFYFSCELRYVCIP